MVYIVLNDKGRLRLDIWPKIPQKAEILAKIIEATRNIKIIHL